MILRRITEHVKAQNWFAVGIDFLIVVVGVFVGLQVSNWNTAREERSLDQRYMTRLHDEILTAEPPMFEVEREQELTRKNIIEAIALITDAESVEDLSQDQCDAIFASHIYRPLWLPLPTLDELLASGRALILSNDDLRKAIMQLSQLQTASENFNSSVITDAVVLSRQYPEMIKLNKVKTFDRYGFAPLGGHTCLAGLMRGDLRFQNDLIDNYYRIDAYLVQTFRPERDQLYHVHRLLDHKLSFQHGTEAKT